MFNIRYCLRYGYSTINTLNARINKLDAVFNRELQFIKNTNEQPTINHQFDTRIDKIEKDIENIYKIIKGQNKLLIDIISKLN